MLWVRLQDYCWVGAAEGGGAMFEVASSFPTATLGSMGMLGTIMWAPVCRPRLAPLELSLPIPPRYTPYVRWCWLMSVPTGRCTP